MNELPLFMWTCSPVMPLPAWKRARFFLCSIHSITIKDTQFYAHLFFPSNVILCICIFGSAEASLSLMSSIGIPELFLTPAALIPAISLSHFDLWDMLFIIASGKFSFLWSHFQVQNYARTLDHKAWYDPICYAHLHDPGFFFFAIKLSAILLCTWY